MKANVCSLKKLLVFSLILCMLISFAICFTIPFNAEEIRVSVGMCFVWNDNSIDENSKTAWLNSNGKSADGLWKYQYYSLAKGVYKDMVAFGKYFAWSSKATADDYGIGYARVGEYGTWFHPGYAADSVKVFTCPSGGSIQISTEIARKTDLKSGTSANGTSFAIYVEDKLVYPEEGGGDYLTLVSSEPQLIDVIVDVAKGERVRIHIGAIGEQSSDGVIMKNTITYKSISDADNHSHLWSDWKITKSPTCTVAGEETRTCSCGEKETRSISMTGHIFGVWTRTKTPTCIVAGEESRTCSCGKTETRTVEATGNHIYGDWKQTKTPTCTVSGEETRTCSCGKKEVRSINITEHIFGAWKQTKAPTCTTAGEETRTCFCGKTELKTVPAIGHSFGNWIQTKAPTTTSEGELTRTCGNCNYAETSIVAKLPESSENVEVSTSTDSVEIVDTDTVVDSNSTEDVELDVPANSDVISDIPSDSDIISDVTSDSEVVSSSESDITTESNVVDSVETEDVNPSDVTGANTDSLNSESSITEQKGEMFSVDAIIGIVVASVIVCVGAIVLIVFHKKIFHKN